MRYSRGERRETWDATRGEPLAVLRGHEAPVDSVAYSPSGWQIVSDSDNRTVCVSPASVKCFKPIDGRGDISSIVHRLARALAYGPETVIAPNGSGQPITGFPTVLGNIATDLFGRGWAGAGPAGFSCSGTVENDLNIIRLKAGDSP